MNLNEQQILIKDSVRSLMMKEFPEDRVRELCERKEFPLEFDKRIAELGIYGICFPEKYGGSNFGIIEVALVVEELSRFSIDFGISFGLNILGGLTYLLFGRDEHKEKYLPKIVNGKISFSLGYPQPFIFDSLSIENAKISASDDGKKKIEEMTIFTERRDSEKNIILSLIQLNENQSFLIFIPQQVLGKGEVIPTLGRDLLGLMKYDFKNLNLNEEWLMEDEGKRANFIKNMSKFFNFMSCIGNMQTVLEETIQYAKNRVQFGVPIGTFQALQHLISDVKVLVDISKLYGYWAAELIENNRETLGIEKEINMANCFITQSFIHAVNVGIQVMGGYGYIKDNNMERYIRDARMTTYFVEDSFIQKLTIAREMSLLDK